MGLEIVELILAIEDEFDIVISDATLEQMQTPQDFADYISNEYLLKELNGCSSQRGFYKIRKLLIDEFSIKKEDIKPYTPLQYLLQNDIRKKWKKLNKLLDNKLHHYPLSINKEGNITIFTLLVILGSIILNIDENTYIIVGVLVLGFIFSFFFSIILRPLFGKKVPFNSDTIRPKLPL